MKSNRQCLNGLWAAWYLCAVAVVMPAVAGDTNQPPAAIPSAPLSVFKQPITPKEGRDPFFPNSMRMFASLVVPPSKTKDLSSLVIRGKSGTSDRPLVIINDVTFAEGDDRDVITPDGRINIHCYKILGDVVVVEANGQQHQLRVNLKP